MTDHPTPLQAAIDALIANLVALRLRPIVADRMISENNPNDLRDLSELSKDVARYFDPFFHEIGYQSGLSSHSGASPHANIVTDAICGNLEFELRDRADAIEQERADNAAAEARAHGKKPKMFDPQRAWGTLNHLQQFGRR